MFRPLSALLGAVCFSLTLAHAANGGPDSLHVSPAATKPPLSLPRHYHPDIDLSHYYVSEKLDGMRGYWDGQQLWTKQGNAIHAPAWFTAGFPDQPLDGELWTGRGQFEQTVATVRKQQPVDTEWRQVSYHVFDLPASKQVFSARLQRLRQLIPAQHPRLKLVPQWQVSSHQALQRQLDEIVAQGGEGLILHRADSHYRAGRNGDFLKLKPVYDAEATVIGHHPGKGKFAGMLGSLRVRDQQGKEFSIGTGFSTAERKQPPAIGTVVSYRYRGHTVSGQPRHASFLRVRADHGL